MKEKGKGVYAAVAISLGLIAGLIIIVPSLLPNPGLHWGVNESSKYSYEFSIVGFKFESGIPYPIPFFELNNTLVSVNITSLPEIVEFNSTEFTEKVVVQDKVDCTTILPEYDIQELEEIISSCILPVGDWQLLDDFYPDPVDYENKTFYRTYLSLWNETHFWFSHETILVNSGEIWSCFLDIVTGVPTEIVYHKYADYCCGEYDYTMTLSLA